MHKPSDYIQREVFTTQTASRGITLPIKFKVKTRTKIRNKLKSKEKVDYTHKNQSFILPFSFVLGSL